MRNVPLNQTPQADKESLAGETIPPLDPNLLSPPATKPELPPTQPPMDAATEFNNLGLRGPSLDASPSQAPVTSYSPQAVSSYVPQYPSKYEYREYTTESYKTKERPASRQEDMP